MVSRGLILTAMLAFVAALGCSLTTGGSGSAGARTADESATTDEPAYPRQPRTEGLPLVGVAMQIQRTDWVEEYKTSMNEIAERGADTVLLVVDMRQENGGSSRVYLDMRMTPSAESLAALIQHAKSLNLRVILMPIVLLDKPRGNEWRGTIKPASWDDWFDSYRDAMHHFSWIAEGNGVDVLVVGSELVTAEKQVDQWRKTIRDIRKTYRGALTYSANWDVYRGVPFWDELDMVGMNSYWTLGSSAGIRIDVKDLTVDHLKARWREIQADLLAFSRKVDKPLLLTEVGWCSLANAAHDPWDYTDSRIPVDLELQRKLYQAFFESWWNEPSLGGFMIWEWSPEKGGKKDRGYTPEGKPAEKVLREWFAKPRWDVGSEKRSAE